MFGGRERTKLFRSVGRAIGGGAQRSEHPPNDSLKLTSRAGRATPLRSAPRRGGDASPLGVQLSSRPVRSDIRGLAPNGLT